MTRNEGRHNGRQIVAAAPETLIARFASHPVAGNAANDATSLPAYHAIARHLMSSKIGADARECTRPCSAVRGDGQDVGRLRSRTGSA